MCLPQTISDFPEGQFQILISTAAPEEPFGTRTFSEPQGPGCQKTPPKRSHMLMKGLNLLAPYSSELLCD